MAVDLDMKIKENIKKNLNIPAKNKEYERCVLCNELTMVRKTMNIDCREHYVYGIGQLCLKCYHKTY